MSAASMTHELFRVHGGKIDAARVAFPGSREPWIDLSTGISPWSYPFATPPRSTFERLPEPEAMTTLEQTAAASFGVFDAACVVATAGSDLALRLMGTLWADKRPAVVRPGYCGHLLAWTPGAATQIHANDLEPAAERYDVVVLANPNNPDGRTIERHRLLNAAETLEARGGALLVDEAFVDAVPSASVCNAIREGLVVLRSFGKFFGLAGLRLGFVIAMPATAARLRRLLGDWPIAGPTAAIASEAYANIEWQTAQRRRLTESSQRLDAMLRAANLQVLGGTALFRLARCRDADVAFRQLAAAAILTRPFSTDATLLRIGLPADEAQWLRLATALGVAR